MGDTVFAIGNLFGFGNTVTAGIVSALYCNHLGINRFEDFIQTAMRSTPAPAVGSSIPPAT